jgi:tRNA-2-methylthio-N6-dimethylallyladenosine synthase
VREARFADSYSFKYSPRPGTAAADHPDPVAPGEAQERLEALQSLQRELTLAYHRGRVGEITRVLVEGPSRRAEAAGAGPPQLAGRDPYHRVVNFRAGGVRPGDCVAIRLVEATPHSLIGEPVFQPGAGAADERSHAAAFA